MVILEPGKTGRAAVENIPPEVQALLQSQETQIMPAELLAVPVTLQGAAAILRGKDLVIRSACAAEDCSLIAFQTSMISLGLGSHIWFEYVPSEQNVSDPLTRLVVNDALVRQKIQSKEWV